MYNTLFETARRTQPELIAYLGPKAVQRTFYIVNAIAASGSWDTIVGLANRADVVYIEALGSYSIPNPQPAADLSIATAEWGVGKIGADQVWNEWGIRGDGIVVASIDTGVYSSHPALVSQYRGTASGSHNYNWYDPTNTYPTAPGDNNGHGTHTVGTMVGVDGTTQTGVAPAAQWIAAKGCSSSSCNSIDLLAAAEWVLAPYPIGGSASSGSASQRPHVVNNSWGGGGGDLWYQAAVTAWRAAGIFPAFAAGNSGPDAGSIGSPGDYADSFASGATDSNDNIASFSGRGPSSLTSETKPDISAPGYSIRSTWNDGLYNTISGTSMASPHTAGCVALVRAANSSLTVSQIEAILTSTATDLGDTGPDDNFGYGRLNCYAAVAQARTDVWLTASPLTGQVASRGSTTVQLGVNTTHLANGDYTATLTISSTDPDESTLAVPVTLHVSDGGVPIPPTATPTATRTPAPTATPTFTPVTPDSNDDFDAAEVLSTMPYSSNQDTYGATTAADDPQMPCVSSKKYNTVWYKYSPTSSGNLAVNTYGSSFDTVLAIWTGSRGALQSVACNDDDSGWQSAVEAPVLAGTTYYIEVAGYYLSSYGTLNLSASLNYAATPVPTATPIPTATATPDAPPQITAVNLTDAGNTLEIIGSNFVNPVTASLGTYPLSGITYISSGQLTAAVPSALPPGTYPLLVTNPDGQMAFYPAALTVGSSTLDILGISPERGSTDLPTLLHAFGLNFSQDTTIMLDDQPLVTQFVDQNSLWAIVPAGQTARKYDVSVVENGSTDTLFLAYTVFSATDDDLLSTSNLLWTDPGTLRAGSPAKTGLVVYHQGGGQTLTDVEVSFEIDTPAGNTLTPGTGISDLPPNRYNTTTPVTWTPSTAGIYTLRATIDPDNGIPESDETNNTIERTVTVLPATIDATPPDIDSFTATLPPASTLAALQVTATDPAPGSGVNSVMFIEYEFSDSARQWAVVRQSDWLRYQTTPYGWEVSSTAGMKYLQAWVADGAGNISLTPASGLLNYVPAADSLLEGQARLYRYRLAAGEQITVRTEPSSGDPDIYLWATASTTPDASSYAAGAAVDQISYTASQATTVQIAIYGYTAAQFGQSIQVVAAGSSSAVTSGPESTEVNAKTPLDDAIVTADNSPSDRQGLPDAPIKTGSPAVYLPVIVK